MTLCVLVGCEAGGDTSVPCGGDTIALRHAENITLVRYDDAVLATLRNPWDTTRVLHRYLIVQENNDSVSERWGKQASMYFDDATIVHAPLRRAAVYTSMHAALLVELGCLERIGGVCDAPYIRNDSIHARLRRGEVHDYGSGMSPTLEMIMDARPDGLMPSPFQNSGYGRIEKLEIPIIECADYMETSPLGRAEWMRFYGMLFGVEERADSLFAAVENRYLSLRDSALLQKSRPLVMCDMLTSSTWFVPGARSTMGRMITDAGGEYVFRDLSASGSVGLTFETVLDRAADADLWLIKYNAKRNHTYKSLREERNTYAHFRPYKTHRVYGCNTHFEAFFEEAAFHPDLVLRDFVNIFHSDGGNTRYYRPLE